jgi:hypothetical protein
MSHVTNDPELPLVNLLDDLAKCFDMAEEFHGPGRTGAADAADMIRDLRFRYCSAEQIPPGGIGAGEWLDYLCEVLPTVPLKELRRRWQEAGKSP